MNGALHSHFAEAVIGLCKESPFSILYDESSDVDKIYLAILVRLWDDELGKPVTRFFDMPVCNIGRVEVIFNRIAGKPAKSAYICSYWQ